MLDALRYPLAGETPRRTVATGALLSALGILVIPGILVAGYYGRVLARSAADEDRPPSFDGWGSLFVQGLKTWLVVAVYLAVAVSVVLVLTAASVVLGESGTGAGAAVGVLALVVAGLVALAVLFGPAWFFLPAVLTHVARNDDVGAAFDVGGLRRIACRREYLVAWFVGATVMAVGSMVYGLLGGFGGIVTAVGGGSVSVPAVVLGLAGHAVGAAANFYCQVVALAVFGRGYRTALDTVEGTPDDDQGWGAEARAWRERRQAERERAG